MDSQFPDTISATLFICVWSMPPHGCLEGVLFAFEEFSKFNANCVHIEGCLFWQLKGLYKTFKNNLFKSSPDSAKLALME
jgi:hypothetical protein